MSAPNPLVAERQDSTQWYSGLGIVESINDTADGIESGSWIDTTLGVAGTGLDALGLVLDPVGSVVAWGVAWLMEHLEPLSDALDALAGDPDQIRANAQTWKNVSDHLATAASDLRSAVMRDIAEWSGQAAGAYRFSAQDQHEALAGLTRAAGAIGTGVELAGTIVGVVREIVRDLIAECIATLAVRLPMWLAEIGLTLGIGTAWVAGQVATLVAKWVKRIAKFIEALIKSFRKLSPLLSKLDELIEALRDVLRRMSGRDPMDPNAPRGRDHDGDGTPDSFDPDYVPPPLHRDNPLPTRDMGDRYRHETDPNHPDNPFRPSAVRRLSDAELEQYRVVVGPDGLLRRSDGTVVDTTGASSAHHGGANREIFIMDEHGNMYMSPDQEVGVFHHSTLSGGRPVTGAGELEVVNGEVRTVTDHSGHYRPTRTNTQNVMDELGRQGVDTDGVGTDLWAPEGT
ncbi:MAG TPA: hypothetical protein VF062_08620 [Candidatus Limnocylindrales bacterium]